jgi:hypothetical protein
LIEAASPAVNSMARKHYSSGQVFTAAVKLYLLCVRALKRLLALAELELKPGR